ncbi:MAG: NapC/NirT family cytochrome c [Nitrospira sp.]|nr:NapC/NirT family cytochrome c [bacterium]MBL7050307.1 NapC/NirT family cytochrome c [Nitrospira sp.]
MSRKAILTGLTLLIAIALAGLFSAEYYTSRPSFCGSCHIMKKYYNSWKNSAHGKENITCVECHYPPGEKHALRSKFKGLGQLFTYLGNEPRTVTKRARISDRSCNTSNCHRDEKNISKKISFLEKTPYVHNSHNDVTIEGQPLHCDSCHQHVRAEKHFEVTSSVCYLCHFKKSQLNEGKDNCSLCHAIPTGSIVKQIADESPSDAKTITHQSLAEAKVPCRNCHYQIVQGKGGIKTDDCTNCHEYSPETISKSDDKKAMHTIHVSDQNAGCFDCHERIEHKNMEPPDLVRLDCQGCHPDHHRYAAMLLRGDEKGIVPLTPALMQSVGTTCTGCHTKVTEVKGEVTLTGSAKTCSACHTAKHEGMVEEWKTKTGEELQYALQLESEALSALKKGTNDNHVQLEKALILLKEGQENIRIVKLGNGVHNKKYSVMLLDAAMNNFEDLIEILSQ